MIVIGIPTYVRLDTVGGVDAVVMTVALDKVNRADVVVPTDAISDAWPDPAGFVRTWQRLAKSIGPWAWAVELERHVDSVRWHGWMDLEHDVDLKRLEAAEPVE